MFKSFLLKLFRSELFRTNGSRWLGLLLLLPLRLDGPLAWAFNPLLELELFPLTSLCSSLNKRFDASLLFNKLRLEWFEFKEIWGGK